MTGVTTGYSHTPPCQDGGQETELTYEKEVYMYSEYKSGGSLEVPRKKLRREMVL